MKRTNLLLAILLLCLPALASGKAKVFILSGQSNMSGGGHVEEGGLKFDEAVSSQVRIWDATKSLSKREFSMKWLSLKELQSKKAAIKTNWIGPEFGFAKAMAKSYPADEIYFIKVSRGGTDIAYWLPPKKGKPNGYTVLIANLEGAPGKIEDDYEIVGMIWMQGESDTKKETTAKAYQQNLEQLISLVRAKVEKPEMPVIIGRLSSHILKSEKFNFPFTAAVQAAQEAVAKNDNNVEIINTDDLSQRSDLTHFDAPGQIKLGERFGEAMRTKI